MGLLSRGVDLYSALRFLRLLTTRWEDTGAFKAGIVDAKGNQLIRGRDVPPESKQFYTLFHRLVFNIKRLLQKAPLIGNSILLNYASALLLLREHLGIDSDEELARLLNEQIPGFIVPEEELREGKSGPKQIELKRGILVELNKDLLHPYTLEPIFVEGSKVRISEKTDREIFGIPIYEGLHENTGQKVFLSAGDCVLDLPPLKNEDAAAVGAAVSTTTGSVGNLDVAFFKRKKKNERNISVFDIDDDSFSKLINPKIKHKRWSDYMDVQHEQYGDIRKSVTRGDLVILRDSKGNSCSLRNYRLLRR